MEEKNTGLAGGDAALDAETRPLSPSEMQDFLAAGRAGFRHKPHVAAVCDAATSATRTGEVIGPYKLIEPLGEGGFGIVWRVEQTEPIHREVALKVIKPGLDSREIIARFEAERQALALMDHPNIAAVLDAGTTANGRPYFVMELVRGVPITDYCNAHKRTVRQRLELFIPVCQAVQHAHQKAILHRDLKPSNILVTEVDGKPVPKVIDFGIAKALGGSTEAALQGSLLQTREGAVIGTIQYMSPEQAGASPDMDTRSDIYTLGVILYELLTGNTPLPREKLRKAAFDEALRLIREGEPERPSSRVMPITDAVRQTSSERGVEPAKLTRALRGDLDWITLKALEKERERRYESAAALAQDLERHLTNEPVEAGPPSALYRLRKLVRRNQMAFGAAVAIVVLLIVGGAVSTWQAVRATKAEKLAVVRLEEATMQTERATKAETLAVVRLEDATMQADRAKKAESLANQRLEEATVQTERAKKAEALANDRFARLEEATKQAERARQAETLATTRATQAETRTAKEVVRAASTSLILLFQAWDISGFRGQELNAQWQAYWRHIKDLSSLKESDVPAAVAAHAAFLAGLGNREQQRLTEKIPLHLDRFNKAKTSPPLGEADDFCKKLKSD